MKSAPNSKTKLCCIRNICFFSRTCKLHYQNPNLENSKQVTWTFEDQINNKKNVTIPQDNNNDPLIKPVRSLVSTVQLILSHPVTATSKIQDNNRTLRNPYDEGIITQKRRTYRSPQNSSIRMSMQDSNFQQRQTLYKKCHMHALHLTV